MLTRFDGFRVSFKPRFLTNSAGSGISASSVFGQLLRQLVQHRGRKVRIVSAASASSFSVSSVSGAVPARAAIALATNSVVTSFLLLSLAAGGGCRREAGECRAGLRCILGMRVSCRNVFRKVRTAFFNLLFQVQRGWPAVYPAG